MNQPNSRFLRLVGMFAIAPLLAIHLSHAAPADDAATFDGTVVDEQDAPLAGVTVRGMPSLDEQGVMSDAGGKFRLPLPNSRYAGLFLIVAKHEDGRQGVFQWKQGTSLRGERSTDQPIRIVLKAPRQVAVEVVDSAGQPVEGAQVAVMGIRFLILTSGVTDRDGRWTAQIPVDVMFDHIMAVKAGAGFDHFGTLEEPRSIKYKPLPEKVQLKLGGARTIRIKTVDSTGEPIANIDVSCGLVRSEGQIDMANTSAWKALRMATDATGTVSFDWLSPNAVAMLTASAKEFGRSRPTNIQPGAGPVELTFQLLRRAKLSGRVLFVDGRPAPNIRVETGGESVLTDASGAYELFADGNKSHIVSIADDKWAAPSHVGVLVSEGQVVPGLDFTLTAGAVVRGQVRIGPDHRPLAYNTVVLVLEGGPSEPTGALGSAIPTRAAWVTKTDQEGNYRLCVFPGTYELRMISPVRPLIITLSEQAELVRDFQLPRAPLIGLEDRTNGTVVDELQQPVADALVRGAPRSPALQTEGAVNRTNLKGKFDFLLPMIPVMFHAQTRDGHMAGIARIETDEAPRVIRIAPTATAHGRLLNDKGQPVAGARLQFGIRVHEDIAKPNGPAATSFGGIVTTSAEGRFELRSLIPNEEYALESEAEPESNRWSPLSTIKAVKPEAVELGDIRLRPAE